MGDDRRNTETDNEGMSEREEKGQNGRITNHKRGAVRERTDVS